MTLKPGDVILTSEQLENLPPDTIIKTRAEATNNVNVGIIKETERLYGRENYIRLPGAIVHAHQAGQFVRDNLITILELGKRKWRTNDQITAWEQTQTLPLGTILVEEQDPHGIWVKDSAVINLWAKTGTDKPATTSNPINPQYFPMRILRVGEKGEH